MINLINSIHLTISFNLKHNWIDLSWLIWSILSKLPLNSIIFAISVLILNIIFLIFYRMTGRYTTSSWNYSITIIIRMIGRYSTLTSLTLNGESSWTSGPRVVASLYSRWTWQTIYLMILVISPPLISGFSVDIKSFLDRSRRWCLPMLLVHLL